MSGVIQKYDRTDQLLDKDNIVDGGAFYPSVTGNKMIESNNTAILLLPCKPNTTYTISRRNVITKRFVMCFITSDEIYADMPIYGDVGDDTALTLTSTSTAESRYLCFYYAKTGGSGSSTPEEIQNQLAEIMINEGPTALPFAPYLAFKDIPYTRLETATDVLTSLPVTLYTDGQPASAVIKGNLSQSGTPSPSSPIYPTECGDLETTGEHAGQYKIPILSGGTIANMFLGGTQSTRRIKELVLTGEEEWSGSNGAFYLSSVNPDYMRGRNLILAVCSHYNSSPQGTSVTTVPDKSISFSSASSVQRFYLADSSCTDTAGLQTYLQQQYANGTPVTVWYVLATETTGILNEPIRKIGDYSDSASVSNIPTTGTAEQFDVDTSLKPSEVDLTYHGWHEHEAQKRDNGQWV